ncbi:hypothetical protein [Nocardioides sp. KR10-350]
MYELIQPQYEAELEYRREQLRRGVAVRVRRRRLKALRHSRLGHALVH